MNVYSSDRSVYSSENEENCSCTISCQCSNYTDDRSTKQSFYRSYLQRKFFLTDENSVRSNRENPCQIEKCSQLPLPMLIDSSGQISMNSNRPSIETSTDNLPSEMQYDILIPPKASLIKHQQGDVIFRTNEMNLDKDLDAIYRIIDQSYKKLPSKIIRII